MKIDSEMSKKNKQLDDLVLDEIPKMRSFSGVQKSF